MNVPSIKRCWRSYSSRNKASYSPTPNHRDTGVSGAISGLGTRRNALCVEKALLQALVLSVFTAYIYRLVTMVCNIFYKFVDYLFIQ